MKKLLTTNYYLLSNRGFTLIETLVALAIFSVSITALISTTGTGVADTNYAKNKFTASYLAQEGVEMVRNIRDTTLLSGGDWNQFIINISGCTNLATGCMIEPKDLSVVECSQGCWNFVYEDTQTGDGFYTYSSQTGSDTNLTRKITVEDFGGAGVNVTSEVSWFQGNVPHSASYSQILMYWIQPASGGPPLE